MPRLRHSVERILAKPRETEVAMNEGQTITHVCRNLGITEQSYDSLAERIWRPEDRQVNRLKNLERENSHLKRAMAELTINKLILKESPEEE